MGRRKIKRKVWVLPFVTLLVGLGIGFVLSQIKRSFSASRGCPLEAQAYLKFKQIKTDFIPQGVPEDYGSELGISFDRVQEAINKVRVFGPTFGQEGKKIILVGKDKERYIRIGKQTACRYCCGVDALVKDDGEAACGCAHSIMMRGLAAYLIKNRPQWSDDKILAELNRWRRTFFPKQTLAAELQRRQRQGDKEIELIIREFPDFLPEMVGGC